MPSDEYSFRKVISTGIPTSTSSGSTSVSSTGSRPPPSKSTMANTTGGLTEYTSRSTVYVTTLAGTSADAMDPIAMADVPAKVVTYTVDRLVYSVSPPVVFAIVDFEGGGRLPVELTDVEPHEVEVGMPVEMTFRKLYSSDGIQNYFWKARPVRGEAQKRQG